MKRSILSAVLVTTLMLFGMVSIAGADMTVSGTITADTTWTAAGSPYLVTSTVTVNTGVTLTVEAGGGAVRGRDGLDGERQAGPGEHPAESDHLHQCVGDAGAGRWAP